MFTTLTLVEIIIATRCYILRLKCTKFDVGWGFVSDPAGKLDSNGPTWEGERKRKTGKKNQEKVEKEGEMDGEGGEEKEEGYSAHLG